MSKKNFLLEYQWFLNEIGFKDFKDDKQSLLVELKASLPSSEVYWKVAMIEWIENKNPEQAEILLKQAIETNPSSREASLILAFFYAVEIPGFAVGQTHYRAAILTNPDWKSNTTVLSGFYSLSTHSSYRSGRHVLKCLLLVFLYWLGAVLLCLSFIFLLYGLFFSDDFILSHSNFYLTLALSLFGTYCLIAFYMVKFHWTFKFFNMGSSGLFEVIEGLEVIGSLREKALIFPNSKKFHTYKIYSIEMIKSGTNAMPKDNWIRECAQNTLLRITDSRYHYFDNSNIIDDFTSESRCIFVYYMESARGSLMQYKIVGEFRSIRERHLAFSIGLSRPLIFSAANDYTVLFVRRKIIDQVSPHVPFAKKQTARIEF